MKFRANNRVVAFTRETAVNGHHHNEVLSKDPLGIPAGDYTFVYQYPLEQPAEFKHPVTETASIIDIFLIGKADYEAIYKAEEDAVGHPGNSPGLLNRASSHGPHGIWGHDLSDLFFEGLNVSIEAKTIKFVMGS